MSTKIKSNFGYVMMTDFESHGELITNKYYT